MFPIALKQKTEKQIFNLHPLNVADLLDQAMQKENKRCLQKLCQTCLRKMCEKTMSIVHVTKTFVARLLVMFNAIKYVVIRKSLDV